MLMAYASVYVGGVHEHAMVPMWRSEDSFIESILSFHPSLSLRDQTGATGLSLQALLVAEPSC